MSEIRARPMAYSEAGAGGHPILLVHGLTGGKVDFDEWLEPLAQAGWHAVAPDVRGHGETGGPRDVAEYTPAHVCADMLMLVDDLGWDSFVLLGHSLGGVFAQHLALEIADRVHGLILMDTAHGAVDWIPTDLMDVGVAIALAQGMAALSDAIAAIAPPTSESDVQQALRARRPDLVSEDHAKFIATVPEMFAAGAGLLTNGPDRLDRLRHLDTPTLVLVGELDVAFLEHSQRLASAIPSATLSVLDGAGHSPQRETPDAWWREVSAFLGGLTHV